MRHLLTGLSAIVLLAYPFAIYYGIDKFGLSILGATLAVFFVLRIFTASRTKLKEFKQLAIISGLIGITLIVLGILFRSKGWLLFYPVAVNACMLMVFASSLKQPQTIIERLARFRSLNSRKVVLITRGRSLKFGVCFSCSTELQRYIPVSYRLKFGPYITV